jgi:hypothetical protein
LKRKREFDHLHNGEVWRWKKVVLELLGYQEPLGCDFFGEMGGK